VWNLSEDHCLKQVNATNQFNLPAEIWQETAQIITVCPNKEDALRFFLSAADFRSSESGAVTTDWLFMCFGVVALGIMVIGGVSGSQLGVAEEISSELASTPSE
jgi:hypothetical protein